MNNAVSIAVSVLTSTIRNLESKSKDEIEFSDLFVLRECAAVIARLSTDELLFAMRQRKAEQAINASGQP